MNGSQTACSQAGTPSNPDDDYNRLYRLLVPQYGFSIDVTLPGSASYGGVPASLIVTSMRSIGEGSISAGENLAPCFVATGRSLSWTVSEAFAFPPGPNLVHAAMLNAKGVPMQEMTYRFDVCAAEDSLAPFEERETWLLLFERDDWTTTWHRTGLFGTIVIESVQEPNGVSDFDEAMSLVGFRSNQTGEGAATVVRDGYVGTNAILKHMLMEEIRSKVRGFFHIQPDGARTPDSINVDFALPTDPDAPAPDDFLPEGRFSLIAIGGDNETQYGCAELDWNNQRQNALTSPDKGIFVTSLLRMVINTPVAWWVLGPFMEGTGVSVGESDLDAMILGGDSIRVSCLDSAMRRRYDQLMLALELTTRAVAADVAHEIGHSVGLVPNGFPPQGLFGGETAAEFAGPRTNSSHIDTPGNNLMAAGMHGSGSWQMIDLTPFAFNEMNLAYLRGRLIYCADFGSGPFEESPILDLSPEEQTGSMEPGATSIVYPIEVTNKSDGLITVDLTVEFSAPISSGYYAKLDQDQLQLGAHACEEVRLTFGRTRNTTESAQEVLVTGQVFGSHQADAVVAITFVTAE
jgi:hypothetical protein